MARLPLKIVLAVKIWETLKKTKTRYVGLRRHRVCESTSKFECKLGVEIFHVSEKTKSQNDCKTSKLTKPGLTKKKEHLEKRKMEL